jgi:predicted dehydrogenase
MEMLEVNKALKPRIGFIGLGWIGLNRMKLLRSQNIIQIESLSDIKEENLSTALYLIPEAKRAGNLNEILLNKPAGVIIATPNVYHAEQAIHCMEKGAAVFCQKPLARTAHEVRQIVETARLNNVLLGVDFSYRYTEGIQKIFEMSNRGALGKIFAVNLTFHNAYGPDKNWFYDPKLSGGGCVIDLGIHLIDLALWILNFPTIVKVSSSLFSLGEKIKSTTGTVEDYAIANLETENGTSISLSCSWNLQAGQDAQIEATFYGTQGGASFRNVNGSFYDFEAYRFYSKTKREIIATPPDDWGGRASLEWAKRLIKGERFNKDAYQFIKVAEVIDRIYKR